jgi:hypothetical protein
MRSGLNKPAWSHTPAPRTRVTAGIMTAALDPFRGYANAIPTNCPPPSRPWMRSKVVKLGSSMVHGRRRTAQRETLGRPVARAIRSIWPAGPCRLVPKPHLKQAARARCDAHRGHLCHSP